MTGKAHRIKPMIVRQHENDVALRLTGDARNGAFVCGTNTLRQKTKRSNNGRPNGQALGQAYH